MIDIKNKKENEPFTVEGFENLEFLIMNKCLFTREKGSSEWTLLYVQI